MRPCASDGSIRRLLIDTQVLSGHPRRAELIANVLCALPPSCAQPRRVCHGIDDHPRKIVRRQVRCIQHAAVIRSDAFVGAAYVWRDNRTAARLRLEHHERQALPVGGRDDAAAARCDRNGTSQAWNRVRRAPRTRLASSASVRRQVSSPLPFPAPTAQRARAASQPQSALVRSPRTDRSACAAQCLVQPRRRSAAQSGAQPRRV